MQRFRNLRKNSAIRELVAETQIQISDFIVPIFVQEGKGIFSEIPSMPGVFRYSLDLLEKELNFYSRSGIKGILVFAKIEEKWKTESCEEAWNPEGLLPNAIRTIRKLAPDLNVFSDIALDPYSPYGHDGLVKNGEIINDETVEALVRMSLVHAEAGVDFLAPSDMMDSRVRKIRESLDSFGYIQTGIMSYSAKYASALYGPFRDALDSAPGFGDKKTYQMDFRNSKEAIKEAVRDWEEGADIVMVKPAGYYLDIIHQVKEAVPCPVAAYQVSGEYSMIRAAAEKGWLELDSGVYESIIAIKRAGADMIVTYFVKDLIRILEKRK
jgi:porphobilinogen synthase